MSSRLKELREKYPEDKDFDPKPVVYKNSQTGEITARYEEWASRTSEVSGEEFFEPRPEFNQNRAAYQIPILGNDEYDDDNAF